MRKLAILAFLVPGLACAQNGLQQIGFSLKQLALAGAVTANPQTPMTIITNPAGLSILTPQTEWSVEAVWPTVHATFIGVPGGSARSNKDFAVIPSGAFVADTSNKRLKVGGALAPIAGAGVDFSWPSLGRSVYSGTEILKIAPAASYEVSREVAVGLAINYNIATTSITNPGFGAAALPSAFAQDGTATGLGYAVGVLYTGKCYRLGATYVSKGDFGDTIYHGTDGEYRAAIEYPQQLAFGLHLFPEKKLSFSLDYKWLNYAATQTHLYLTGPSITGVLDLNPQWEDDHVIALAAMYKPIRTVELMAGYNHNNAIVRSNHITESLLFPAINQDAFTLGATYESSRTWNLGIALVTTPKRTVSDGIMQVSVGYTALSANATLKF
jgi:long-chain fatty acid transport protein